MQRYNPSHGDLSIVTDVFEGIEAKMRDRRRTYTKTLLLQYLQNDMHAEYAEENYEMSSNIYMEGDECDSLFVILEGEVDVVQRKSEGTTEHVLVEALRPGDFFPLGVAGLSNLRTSRRGATAICKTNVKVARVDGPAFRSYIGSMPRCRSLGEHMKESILERHDDREDELRKPTKPK